MAGTLLFNWSFTSVVRVKIWKSVPESVHYLLGKGQMQEAHQVVREMEKEGWISPRGKNDCSSCWEKAKVTFADIWAPQFFKRTIMLWILWFGIVYSYYGIFTWLPSLMVGQGYTVIKTFEYVLIMTLAQLPGYLRTYLVDRDT